MSALGGFQRGGQGSHHADALALADSLAAHLLVHADDRHTNVLCHVLCAVGNFAHAAAQVQHGIHAFLSGFHVHADQACCRCSGHIACRANICQNAGVLQAVQLHIIAQLLFDLLLHQFDQFRGGAGIDQTYLHNGKASFFFRVLVPDKPAAKALCYILPLVQSQQLVRLYILPLDYSSVRKSKLANSRYFGPVLVVLHKCGMQVVKIHFFLDIIPSYGV